jgi:hypothetical protein
MSQSMSQSSQHVAEQELPELKVLVMYEDVAARDRATSLLDRLAGRTGMETGLSRNLWMFNLLNAPLLREQAAVEAAAADMVIFSVNGKTARANLVEDWLMRWLDHKEERPYAFGVLLDADGNGTGAEESVLACVRRFANAGGADFFCSSRRTTAAGSDARFNAVHARANSSSDVLEEILKLGR